MNWNRSISRIGGNWLTSFLSPLAGTSIAFSLPLDDINLKILLTALISASIITGLSIGYELRRFGEKDYA